jgi:tetratricopeptide (TPR) repeat protein
LDGLLAGDPKDVPSKVIAIIGVGGVGKSCLCRKLIEMPVAERFARVVWASLYEARLESVTAFLHELLTQGFDWKEETIPLEGSKENRRLVRELCKIFDESSTLLVLDGFEVVQFTDPESSKYGAVRETWKELDQLLRHLLNGGRSACLISSRVRLLPYTTILGYEQHDLDVFSFEDGGRLLGSLGVKGTKPALENCARDLGGHALSIVAAGRYLARRGIPAERFADLIGDPAVFRSTAEGEKVQRICQWYRAELTGQQEYFLTRLSLLGRSISVEDYPVVIAGFTPSVNHDDIEREIVEPLVERGLVDKLRGDHGITSFSAHPLMKLAYSTWLEQEERKRTHEDWAHAAAAAPGLFFSVSEAMTLQELQPLVEAIDQYLAAENWHEAWTIYMHRGVGERLGHLGYYELALGFAKRFEEVKSRGSEWRALDSVLLFDRLAWLSARMDSGEERGYRRKELEVARRSNIAELPQVQRIVAISLADAGFLNEADEVQSRSHAARGVIALMRGSYRRAASLLRRDLHAASGHDRTVGAQRLAEALYRDGLFEEAKRELEDGLRLATPRFECCQSSILWKLIEVALRQGDLDEARRWAEIRRELRRQKELDADEHYWLLLEEGDFDSAFEAASRGAVEFPGAIVERSVRRIRVLARSGKLEEARAELDAARRARASSGYGRLDNDIAQLTHELRC